MDFLPQQEGDIFVLASDGGCGHAEQMEGCESGGPPLKTEVEGNSLTVFDNGPDIRAALIDLIDGAKKSLKLYYYIFDSSPSGRKVMAHLIRALRRGVHVTLMVDSFGSSGAEDGFFNSFMGAGGHFGWFGTRHSTRYLIRNHQKMAIADEARAMIGGFNVSDPYFGTPDGDCWRDMGLIIEGPQVHRLVIWHRRLWHWVSSRKQSFRSLRALIRNWDSRPDPQGCGFRWLIGGPTRLLSPWARQVKHDLEQAQRLSMVAAYFSPSTGMLRRIRHIARRGEVQLVMASKSDNTATVSAARYLYKKLLGAGARIWEYQPCKLHMKLIVIDDAVYIGSANFDMRSLFINLELMLRIEDKDFAETMRGFIAGRQAESAEITAAYERRHFSGLSRLNGWLSYLLVGTLDYTVTRRLNFRATAKP